MKHKLVELRLDTIFALFCLECGRLLRPKCRSSKQLAIGLMPKRRSASRQAEDDDAQAQTQNGSVNDDFREEEDDQRPAKRLRKGGIANTALRGSIKLVELENFLTHARLQVELGPHVNFVAGMFANLDILCCAKAQVLTSNELQFDRKQWLYVSLSLLSFMKRYYNLT